MARLEFRLLRVRELTSGQGLRIERTPPLNPPGGAKEVGVALHHSKQTARQAQQGKQSNILPSVASSGVTPDDAAWRRVMSVQLATRQTTCCRLGSKLLGAV